MTPCIPLGELCEFVYGDSLKEERRRGGHVPVYGSNGIVGLHDQAITRGPTIIVGRKGSIGEVHFSAVPCFPIDTTYYVDATKVPCELRWLYFTLLKLDLTRFNKAAAVPGLNREDAYEQLIPCPDTVQQKRIAAILDQTDRLRRIRRYSVELGDDLLSAAFLNMFGDPEDDPHKWPHKRLGELCAKVIDCPHATPIYAPKRTCHACIRSSDIQKGFLDFADTKYVDFSEYEKRIERGKPMRGDVIYCREGARFGNAGRVLDDSKLCLGQRMMLFRANATLATSEFIWA